MNGPSASNAQDCKVTACDDETIYGELTVLRTWFSSNGLCLVGFEQFYEGDDLRTIHQEWWCVPVQTKENKEISS